jgi:hypothetical protein
MDFVKFLFTILKRFVKGIPDSTYEQLELDWRKWIDEGKQKQDSNKILGYFFKFQDDFRTKTILIVLYLFAVKWCLDFMADKKEPSQAELELESQRY